MFEFKDQRILRYTAARCFFQHVIWEEAVCDRQSGIEMLVEESGGDRTGLLQASSWLNAAIDCPPVREAQTLQHQTTSLALSHKNIRQETPKYCLPFELSAQSIAITAAIQTTNKVMHSACGKIASDLSLFL